MNMIKMILKKIFAKEIESSIELYKDMNDSLIEEIQKLNSKNNILLVDKKMYEKKIKLALEVYNKPLEYLKKQSNFEVSKEDNKWVVYTEICNLGGCSMKPIYTDSELSAYRIAMQYTIIHGTQSCNYPCNECHQEYLKDCI